MILKHQVMYFVGVPKGYDRAIPWPLVIKLPAEHLFVTNPRPGPDEVTKIYTDWIRDELAKHPDAVILMPVLNLDELWGPSYAGVNSVIQPMYHVAGRLNIDPARIYMLGKSGRARQSWSSMADPISTTAIFCLNSTSFPIRTVLSTTISGCGRKASIHPE